VLKERHFPVPPYAPQIPPEMPVILCNEKTTANRQSYDIAEKMITIIYG
jgi:hypothetical protein